MILLTMQCERCSKEVSHNMTNKTLSSDLIRKFGFGYAHNGKTNVLICNQCEKLFKGLKEKIAIQTKTEMCSFFQNCGKDKENGNTGKPKDD